MVRLWCVLLSITSARWRPGLRASRLEAFDLSVHFGLRKTLSVSCNTVFDCLLFANLPRRVALFISARNFFSMPSYVRFSLPFFLSPLHNLIFYESNKVI